MMLFLPEPEIGDDEGFTKENDLFGRKAIGDGLTNLVSTVTDPMVIALDAQWGAGKTTFLKMWAGELRNAGFPVVYFDAYCNDYAEDAFAAIAGEVIDLVRQKKKASTSAGKQFVEKAKGAGKILLRSGLRVGVKALTLSAVDTKDLEEVAKAVADELSELEDKYLGEVLTRQKENKATFKAFTDALSALPAVLGPADAVGPAKPLVFIIDELDRCKPPFALQLLERVKHFFSVPNVHFVLGVHLDQLRNSVIAAYGPQIDAQTYLQKFIHLSVSLRETSDREHEQAIRRFISYLASTMTAQAPEEHRRVAGDALALIRHIAEARGLSLRTVERIATNLTLSLAFSSARSFLPAPLVAGLCTLKVVEPVLYARARTGTLTFAAAKEALRLEVDLKDNNDKHMVEWSMKWWRFCTDPNMPQEEQTEMGQGLYQYNLGNRLTIARWMANEVIERLAPMKG